MRPRLLLIALSLAAPPTALVASSACDLDCERTHSCGPFGGVVAQGGAGGTATNTGGDDLPPDLGQPCDGPNECSNGHCVDGVCCENACDGACLGCQIDGEMAGLCRPESAGTTCEAGKCDGAGVCATGAVLWSQLIGSTSFESSRDVAALADGSSAFVGAASPTATSFGGEATLEPAGAYRAYVAGHGPTGTGLWAMSIGGDDGYQEATHVASLTSGGVVAAGFFRGTLEVPGLSSPPTNPTFEDQAFVVALDEAKAYSWHHVVSSPSGNTRAVALASSAAHVAAVIDGDPVRTTILTAGAGTEAHTSAWTTSDPADLGASAGAAFVGDDLWVARAYQNQVAVETVPLPNPGGASWNLALVRHRASAFTVAPTDVRTFGGAPQLHVFDVAPVGASGFVLVGKLDGGTLALGDEVVEAAAGSVLFVARFDASAECSWTRTVGGEPDGASVGVDGASGAVVVAGEFNGYLDFGGGTVLSSGDPAGFLFKLAPDGADLLWVSGFSHTSSEMSDARVAVGPDGTAVFAATVYGGWLGLPEVGDADVFLMRVAP